MRVVIQRVKTARVDIPATGYFSEIGEGLLVLAAFTEDDTEPDLEWMARKICALRVFDDADGVMNISVRDTGGPQDLPGGGADGHHSVGQQAVQQPVGQPPRGAGQQS